MAALGDSLTAAANLQHSPGARQEKLVISLLFPTLSLLLAGFFPHLQHQFACQGRWQVKSLPDYWNCKVKSNCIHLPWMAIYSQCWPRHAQMRGRWGRQGSRDERDKTGAEKEGQGRSFGSFSGSEVPHPLVFSSSFGWRSWVVSSETPRSCWLLSPPFFFFWLQKLECLLSARNQHCHQRGEIMCLSKC